MGLYKEEKPILCLRLIYFRSFRSCHQPQNDFRYHSDLMNAAAYASLQDEMHFFCHLEPPQNQAAGRGNVIKFKQKIFLRQMETLLSTQIRKGKHPAWEYMQLADTRFHWKNLSLTKYHRVGPFLFVLLILHGQSADMFYFFLSIGHKFWAQNR